MMLFGEKYGDHVRMITFDPSYSLELCGGCHVSHTGEIGYFKIVGENAVAAGVRRIEAYTAEKAGEFIENKLYNLQEINILLKHPQDIVKQVEGIQSENHKLKKQVDSLMVKQASSIKDDLIAQVQQIGGINFLSARIPLTDSKAAKDLAYQLEKEIGRAFILLGIESNGKPQLILTITRDLTVDGKYHAGQIINSLSKEIKGGGGGQPFFASAGGSDVSGLDSAVSKAIDFIVTDD